MIGVMDTEYGSVLWEANIVANTNMVEEIVKVT